MTSSKFRLHPKDQMAAIFINKVHKTLIKAAIKNGYSQSKLAKKLGVDRSVIHRMLMGNKNITLQSLAQICWALDVYPDFAVHKKEYTRDLVYKNIIDELLESQEVLADKAKKKYVLLGDIVKIKAIKNKALEVEDEIGSFENEKEYPTVLAFLEGKKRKNQLIGTECAQ